MMANRHGSRDWSENVSSMYFGYWRGTADFRGAAISSAIGGFADIPRLSARQGEPTRCSRFGAISGNPGKTSGPINQQTVYSLPCTVLDSSTYSKSTTVNLVLAYQEPEHAPTSLPLWPLGARRC